MPQADELQSARSPLLEIARELARRAGPEEAPGVMWPLVCGSAVAQRTRVLNFANGVVRIEVPDGRWRSELAALAPQYVASFNQMLPETGIERVEFVASAAHSAS